MNLFLCLLGPSLFSIRIFNHLNGESFTLKNILFYYGVFVFINNFVSTIISTILFNARNSMDIALTNFPVFTIKYLVVSILLAVIIPFIFKILMENIDYNVEVKKNEKRANSKTRKKAN